MSQMTPTVISDAAGNTLAYQFEQLAMVVPVATNGTSDEVVLSGKFSRAAFDLLNKGPIRAFDQAFLEAQAHPNGAWFTYLSNAELNTGTAIAGRLVLVVINPTTLAADGQSFVLIDCTGLHAMRWRISSATDPVSADIRGSAGVAG